MLTTEQLLQPRYRVLALYPFSPYKVGEIIDPYEGRFPVLNIPGHDLLGRIVFTQHGLPITEADKYPHLFQRCHWSEGRTKEEFPEYLRYDESGIADKVLSVKCNDAGFVVEIETEAEPGYYYRADIYDRPATKEEYEQYKSK